MLLTKWNKFWAWYFSKETPVTVVEPAPYCPIIELLESDPYDWQQGTRSIYRSSYYDYEENRKKKKYVQRWDETSLVHEKLGIEIQHAYVRFNGYRNTDGTLCVIRNGHALPVNAARLKKAIIERDAFVIAEADRKRREEANAELNRLCNDVHTLRVEKIIEYKRLIAIEEQREIDAKIAS